MADRRRWLRLGSAATALLACGGGIGVLLGWPVSWPFDVAWNLGAAREQPALQAPADGKVRVVVLQHGLFRSSASLGALARTLRRHGYEVLNPDYPSTRERIERHAERLREVVVKRVAAGTVDEWSFVGHSLGGLVIEQYLRQPGAVEPRACVYLGTPHRGAVLADLRKHWFLFRWSMGTAAALQLSPADPFHRQGIPWPERSGTVIGDLGAGNPAIPGPDDGTVAVGEARLAGAAAEVVLPCGHTALTIAPAAIDQVLHFLARGAFAAPPGKQ